MTTDPKLDFSNVDTTINAFGGLRPMATALGVPASTVQGWKERNSIPKGRQKEIQAAFDNLDATSDVPVGHAIDAAAVGMVDKTPPEADKETRNYQPPRSTEVQSNGAAANAGGSNLILSLILLSLLGILGFQFYNWFNAKNAPTQSDIEQLGERVGSLENANAAVGQSVEATRTDVSGLSGQLGDLLSLNDRIGATTQQVEQVSGQLGQLATDIDSRADQQASTITNLSRAQTGLFETLSQDLLGQMDTISANMDQSVTDQIRRLEARANAAIEEARNQEQIARANEEKARAAEADATIAQQAMAAGIQEVAAIMQLRLALAKSEPFNEDFVALNSLAESSADLSTAQRLLAEYADSEFGEAGIPSQLDMFAMIEDLVQTDLAAISSNAGFGAGVIPSANDPSSNQGKLAGARIALQSGDLPGVRALLDRLTDEVAAETGPLNAAIDANLAGAEAAHALDRWIAIKAVTPQ